MAGAVPNVGYHISEKQLIRGKMWVFFILEPARLLGACKPGSPACMDSRSGGHACTRKNHGAEILIILYIPIGMIGMVGTIFLVKTFRLVRDR